MTHLLPPNLLKLFNARQPVPYLKPVARDRSLPLGKQLSGVAAILQDLKEQTALNDAEDEANAAQDAKNKSKDAADGQTAATAKASTSTVKVEDAMQEDVKPAVNGINGDAAAKDVDMEEGEEPDAEDSKKPAAKGEADGLTYTEGEKLRQRVAERKRKREEDFKSALKEFDPTKDEKAVGDAYKTLFISRLSYRATEDDLRKEFGYYGPIERIRIVRVEDGKKKGKSRGYAFILYESERDMKAAYKDADGLKIDGRRILVDVERGRTVKGWKPRRLGGGLGGRTKPAPPAQPSFGISTYGNSGGFRGGRGGFGGRGGGFSGRGGFNDRGPPRGGGVGFGGGFSRGPPANAGGNSGFGGGNSGGFQSRDGPPQQANGAGGGFNQRAMIGQQSGSGWGSRPSGGDSSSQSNSYPPRGEPAGYSRGGGSEFEVPRQPQSSGGSYGGSNTGGGYGNRDSRDSGSYRDSREDRGDNKRARY